MKRKEQILEVSLELFNSEGEANLSAVDIANEMDISPGNLYYHYKGKEELIQALFERYEGSIKTLLQEAIDGQGELEEILAIYLVLVEQIYKYRFFYRNLSDLLEKYSDIERRFRRLISLKEAVSVIAIQKMVEKGHLDEEQVILGGEEQIAANVTMILTCLYEYQAVHGEILEKERFMEIALERIIAAISPYSGKLMARHINFLQAFFENN